MPCAALVSNIYFLQVPIFKTEKDGEHRVSYSDHEAVTAHLYLYKHKGASDEIADNCIEEDSN